MSDHTQPTYKDTKLGILEIQEIEQIIFDNLILVQSHIYKNHSKLDISIQTLFNIHQLLVANLFEQAGTYRNHNVQIGDFEPIGFPKVAVEMKELDLNMQHRLQFLTTDHDKTGFIAEMMWKILWIHPFFDYNARVTRLFGELCLLKLGLPTNDFRGITRSKFSEAMKKATFEGDLSDVYKLISS